MNEWDVIGIISIAVVITGVLVVPLLLICIDAVKAIMKGGRYDDDGTHKTD